MKAIRLPRLIALITNKGYTAVELADLLFCTVRSSRDMIAKLRKDNKVHIQSWRKTSVTQWSAVYRYGIGTDAKKPEPLTSRARVLKHRERESIEKKEFRLARQRQLSRKIKRDPLVAAFYGLSKPSNCNKPWTD